MAAKQRRDLVFLFSCKVTGSQEVERTSLFLFCHDEKENSIVFVFDIVIVFVTAGQFHQPTCCWNLSLSLPMIQSRPVFPWQISYCSMHAPNVPLTNGVFLQENQFLQRKIYACCHSVHAILIILIIKKSQSLEDAFFSIKVGTLY